MALTKTFQRVTYADIRRDKVREDSIGLYAQNTTKLTDWVRTIVGVRHDQFWANVTSDTPENSGKADASITSPKVGLVLGPFRNNEIFLNAGYGFHSNDVRGVTISVNPPNTPDAGLPAEKVPFLVRAKGAEVGWRARPVEGLETSIALFMLDYASELLFVGDAGTTEASRPSRRTGVEWTTTYKPAPWRAFDLDLAATRARFTDFDPAGNRVPGAPNVVSSLSVALGQQLGWFGAVKVRYFGPRPLIARPLWSMLASATASITAFASSSTPLICSTPRPTRSPISTNLDCWARLSALLTSIFIRSSRCRCA